MFTLKFNTGNASFDPPYLAEAVANALLDVSKRIRQQGLPDDVKAEGIIRDTNGNTIGKWEHK